MEHDGHNPAPRPELGAAIIRTLVDSEFREHIKADLACTLEREQIRLSRMEADSLLAVLVAMETHVDDM